jgi:hypothetical protein
VASPGHNPAIGAAPAPAQGTLPLRPPRAARPGELAFERIKAEVARVIAGRLGEEHAITGEQLARVVQEALELHGMSLRTVQRRCEEAVEEIRNDGDQLIAATGAGKFTPETVDELERDLRQSTARAMKQLRHRSRVKRALAEMLGQLRIAKEAR